MSRGSASGHTAFEPSDGFQTSFEGFHGQAGSPSNFFVCGLKPIITLEATLVYICILIWKLVMKP